MKTEQEVMPPGWFPYRLQVRNDGTIGIRWFFGSDKAFTEPFFQESVSTCMSLPENSSGATCVTSTEVLVRSAENTTSVDVSAFIFHISRCGSTLLTQLLCCDERNIVLAEVPLLDEILRLPLSKSATQAFDVQQLFHAAMRILGQKRNGIEQHLFVKADSWHISYYHQLREWYRGVPFFLIYRDPLDVALSHRKLPGMHSVPGLIQPELFGTSAEKIASMNRDEYMEQMLSFYLTTFLSVLRSDEHAFALNYHSGVLQMITSVANICHLEIRDDIQLAMENRTGFHSKKPGAVFNGDGIAHLPENEFAKAKKLFMQICALDDGAKHKSVYGA